MNCDNCDGYIGENEERVWLEGDDGLDDMVYHDYCAEPMGDLWD